MNLVLVILVLLIALAAWDLGWWLRGVRPSGPIGLKRALRDGRAPTVLDVRTPAEYAAFHIPGAVNVPYPADLGDLTAALPDRSAPIVAVCMSGHRSPPVVSQLQQAGYTNVRNLTWGMSAWKMAGGETVTGD